MMKKIYFTRVVFICLINFAAQGATNSDSQNPDSQLSPFRTQMAIKLLLESSIRRPTISQEKLEKVDESGNQYLLTGDVNCFRKAVEVYKKLPRTSAILHKLATLYGQKYKIEKNETDLDKSLDYILELDKKHGEALSNPNHEKYYIFHVETLRLAYEDTGNIDYFNKSFKYMNLLENFKNEVLFNQGNLFFARYGFTGNVEDLNNSIKDLKEAVSGSSEELIIALSLSEALQEKYFDSKMLSETERKKLRKEIIEFLEKGKAHPSYTEKKAWFLVRRYMETHTENDYSEALGLAKKFAKETADEQKKIIFLALLLKGKYLYLINEGFPDEDCENHFKKAVSTLQGDSESLGTLYAIKFNRTRALTDLQEAIKHFEEEVYFHKAYTTRENMTTLYFSQYLQSASTKDAKKAIEYCNQILKSPTASASYKKKAKVQLINIFLESQRLGHSTKLKLFFQDMIPHMEALDMNEPSDQFLKARLLMLLENQPSQEIISLLQKSSTKLPAARQFLESLQQETVPAEDLEEILHQGLHEIQKFTPVLEIKKTPSSINSGEEAGESTLEAPEDEYKVEFKSPKDIIFSTDKKENHFTGNIKKLREYRRTVGKSQENPVIKADAPQDQPITPAKDFVVNKKDLLDKLFAPKSNFDEADLHTLLNHDFCKGQLEVKETKSGVIVGESISTHHNHGQTYKGLHRKFLKSLREKISSLLLIQGIADYC